MINKQTFKNFLIIREIKIIIEEIETLREFIKILHQLEEKREEEILGISLSKCKSIEDVENYQKAIEEKGELLNNDKTLSRIFKIKNHLYSLEKEAFKRLKEHLGKLNSNYNQFDLTWIFLKYDDIKKAVERVK